MYESVILDLKKHALRCPMEFCEFGDGIESTIITRWETIPRPKSIGAAFWMDLSLEDVRYGAGIEGIIKVPSSGEPRPRVMSAPLVASALVEIKEVPMSRQASRHPTIKHLKSRRPRAKTIESPTVADAFDREISDYLSYLDFEAGRFFESPPAKAA